MVIVIMNQQAYNNENLSFFLTAIFQNVTVLLKLIIKQNVHFPNNTHIFFIFLRYWYKS